MALENKYTINPLKIPVTMHIIVIGIRTFIFERFAENMARNIRAVIQHIA